MRKLALAIVFALMPGLALAQNVSTVTITNGVPTAGSGTVSTLDNLIGAAGTPKSNVLSIQGVSGGVAAKVDGSAVTQPVSASALPLPAGAATAANQSTANSSLSTIATNSSAPIPDCGATPCTNKIGTVYAQSAYPAGASAITGNATGTTGAVVGTLAAAVSKTTYICGFDVSAIGGTAAVGPITIAGLVGSSMVYYFSSSASGSTLNRTFTPCIPGSASNTAITITTTADGSATGVAVNSWGFQQ